VSTLLYTSKSTSTEYFVKIGFLNAKECNSHNFASALEVSLIKYSMLSVTSVLW